MERSKRSTVARGIYPFFIVVVFVEKYLCRGSMIGLLL
jgi:hypothetical protein